MKKMFIVLLTTLMFMTAGCTTKKVPQHKLDTSPHTEISEDYENPIHDTARQNADTNAANDVIAAGSSITNTPDLERFFFVPFESGSTQFSTSNFGFFGDSEVYIGVFGTSTSKDFSGIQNLCRALSEADINFAGELTHFSLWSNSQVIDDLHSPESEIVSVFKKLDQTDHEKFLNLQISVMEQKYKEIMIEQNVEWLLDGSHSAALIGSYYSLLNWMPYDGWKHSISSEKSDKENLISLYFQVFEKTNNTNLQKRFEKQMILALDMIYGVKSYQEITNWMINPEW